MLFLECTEEGGTNFTLSRFSQANHVTKKITHRQLLLGQLIWERLSRNDLINMVF